MSSETYFWSGSNHAGEIRALAKHGQAVGVAVDALDKGGRALSALVALGSPRRRLLVNVARSGDRPIVMLCRNRDELPVGDTVVEVDGETLTLGFRKIAVNVARACSGGANVLGSMLRRMFGDDAGKRGMGHKVELVRMTDGWRMLRADIEPERMPSRVFVDSGAFGEVRFDPKAGRMVTVRPITESEWQARLAVYTKLADALGDRAYLVAPDKVGDQGETLARLIRFAPTIRDLRARGANIIVPIQVGDMTGADFDAAVSSILGFDDYVRGIPSKKSAATVEQIAELSASLPASARVHLLGLGPWGARYDEVIAAIGRDPELVSCDSVRIKALVGRTNGRGGKARILTMLSDAARAARGWVGRKLSPEQTEELKFAALDALLAGG